MTITPGSSTETRLVGASGSVPCGLASTTTPSKRIGRPQPKRADATLSAFGRLVMAKRNVIVASLAGQIVGVPVVVHHVSVEMAVGHGQLLQPLAAVDVLEADQRRVGRRPGDRRIAALHFHEVLHGEPVEARPGQHVLVGVDDRRRRLVAEGRLLGGEGKGEIDRLLVVRLLLGETVDDVDPLDVVPDDDGAARSSGTMAPDGSTTIMLADARPALPPQDSPCPEAAIFRSGRGPLGSITIDALLLPPAT